VNPFQSLRDYEEFVYTLLAPTHPHHKHIPPDIKHHRVLAPAMSFTQPNLPMLIEEIEQLLKT